MGLLDNWNSPEGIGLLSAIAGGLATARRGAPLNSIGAAGLAGLMGYANAQDRQQQKQQNIMTNELRNLQLAQAKKAAEQEAMISALAKNHMLTPEQQAISQFGPTQAGIDAIGTFKPKFDLSGFVQNMYGVDPIKAINLQQVLAKETPFDKVNPKDFTPASISKFESSRNYSDLVPIDKPGDPLGKLIAARDALPTGSPERVLYEKAITKATTHAPAPSATVNMPPMESEFQKGIGKGMAEQYGNFQTAAFSAPSKLKQLDRMEQLLQGVEGGKLAPMGLEIASAARSIGLNVGQNVGNKEAAESLSREIAASFRQPGTGPMTDKDFENFLKRVPDLSKTAQGRTEIIRTMRAALLRDIEAGKLAKQYKDKHKTIDGFESVLADFYANNPVVGATQSGEFKIIGVR